jgi:capsular polysaccharide biosynthesis protein
MARRGKRLRRAATAEADGDEPSCRLYVSRADASDRRVRNEDTLLAALDHYGFDRIVPGEHPFVEQVVRFANAEMILGPHGAGLTNMIFAEETTLIELFGSYQNACFFTLARGMGHEYASVTCRPEGEDLLADIGAIESLLDELVTDT